MTNLAVRIRMLLRDYPVVLTHGEFARVTNVVTMVSCESMAAQTVDLTAEPTKLNGYSAVIEDSSTRERPLGFDLLIMGPPAGAAKTTYSD